MKSVFSTLIICLLTLVAGLGQSALDLHPDNPHYLRFRGRPLVLVGSGEHYGAVINLDFDFKTYLQTLAADGLNTTRLFTGAYIEKLGDFGIAKNTLAPAAGRAILPWMRSEEAGYALGGNKWDLSKWNDAYFKRLREFMSEAQRLEIIVEVVLFSSHYGGGWNYSAFNPANNINQTNQIAGKLVNTLDNGNILSYQEAYVRRLVQELNAFDNFYFEIQNEPWADQTDLVLTRSEYGPTDDWRNTLQVVSKKANDWQRQVARWIKEEESKMANRHLIAQNISNFSYPVQNPDPLVSIFTFHYSQPEAVLSNYHLNKVIGFNETGFAGKADSTYRRQAWRFLMAGGGLFDHLDYSFSVGSENGRDTAYTAPGGGSPELRRQLGVLKRFFDQLELPSLRPVPEFIVAAPGARAQALQLGRNTWIVYMEPLSIQPATLSLQLPKGRYQAEWMDVLTGEKIGSPTTISNNQLTAPVAGKDLVVVVK